VLSRLTGYGRVLAQGYALGGHRVADAYNLANNVPNIVYDLVLGGILAGTLVPVFVRSLESQEGEDWEAVSAVCTAVVAALLVASAVFLALVPLIIRLYTVLNHEATQAQVRRLAVTLLVFFVPQLALYGLVSLATALLNARRRYGAPMYVPVLNNLVVIGVMVAFSSVAGSLSIEAVRRSYGEIVLLGAGTTAGVAVMTLALLPALRGAGVRLRALWRPTHPAVATVLRLSGWTAGFVVANQVALLIVSVLAFRRAGDFTAYVYAYMLFQLPHGAWAVSVMSPLERELAGTWNAGDGGGGGGGGGTGTGGGGAGGGTRTGRGGAGGGTGTGGGDDGGGGGGGGGGGDRAEYRRQLLEGLWLTVAILVPAALGYAVLSRPIVALLLQHGAFDARAARATADVLALMSLGLPGFSAYLVLMRSYQAMQDTRSMFLTYLVENGLNIALAFALYPLYGVRGLAGSLSLAYAGGTVVALWHHSRRLGGLRTRTLAAVTGLASVAGAVAASVAWAVSRVGARWHAAEHGPALALRVFVAVAAGVTVYLLAARALGFDEVRSLLQLRKAREADG